MLRYTRNSACLAFALLIGQAAQAQNYSALVLADDPVAYYRFSETSGTTAIDSSTNGNNATYVNAVQLNQPSLSGLGSPEQSVGLDGISAHVRASGLNQTGATRFNAFSFTLETWVNTTSATLTGSQAYQGNGLVWSDVGGNANDFVLAALNNRVSFFTGNPDTSIIGNTVINDGNWHHIVATRDITGASSTLSLWVDGVLDATGTVANIGALSANSDIVIGGNPLDSRYFNGRMDEVALYNAALSSERIQLHYQQGVVPAPGALLTALLGAIPGATLLLRRRRK
jgi:hypothetical protein